MPALLMLLLLAILNAARFDVAFCHILLDHSALPPATLHVHIQPVVDA